MLGLDVSEANLDGVVAVGRLRLHLRDGAGASLDDGDGDDVVVLIPHLRHSELAAKNRADHAHSLPSVVMGPLGSSSALPSGPRPVEAAHGGETQLSPLAQPV